MEPQGSEIPRAGFVLKGIILLKSNFERANVFPVDKEIQNEFRINNEYSIQEDKTFHVILTCNLHAIIKETQQAIMSAEIVMAGWFDTVGETSLPIEEFATKNAVAIIFPFVREHISSLTLKSGIAHVLLPSLNFQDTK